MPMRILGLTTSAFILACGAAGAMAQDHMAPPPEQQQTPTQPMIHEGDSTHPHDSMHEGMMGHGMMGHGMMGEMMGHAMMPGEETHSPPVIFRVMFALMDADGDGTLSLQEFQTAHERIFKAMDANKDGKLTMEEMQAFMRGTAPPPPQH